MSGTTTTEQMAAVVGPDESTLRAGLVPLYAHGSLELPGVFFLGAGETTIGRDPSCTIAMDRQSISRKHAAIQRFGTTWRLTDLGSRNGTIVDGALVPTTQLEQDAEVRVGDVIFKFVESGAEVFEGFRLDGAMHPGFSRHTRHATMLLGGAQIDRLVASIERIATTQLSVILRGESGTGKEVAAREVHRLSDRKGPFVAVNCAAIPGTLLESELFGYRKGAFSGADRDRVGLVRAAHGGTLFLDEIGDMPLEAQSKLLRVLQLHEVLPIGATQAESVDIRVVCATHRDLRAAITQGSFRGDLYARLQEYTVTLPPLRDRKEDIPLLVRAFLTQEGHGKLTPTLGFMVALLHHDWPFNVRELQACLKRAVALCDGVSLDVPQLPEDIREVMLSYGRPPLPPSTTSPGGLPQSSPSAEELRALLVTWQGNVSAVSRALGKERMQVHRWMKRYKLDPLDFRPGNGVTSSNSAPASS